MNSFNHNNNKHWITCGIRWKKTRKKERRKRKEKNKYNLKRSEYNEINKDNNHDQLARITKLIINNEWIQMNDTTDSFGLIKIEWNQVNIFLVKKKQTTFNLN